jgi:ribosomal protein S18 acetylase RimI-like enzyme
MTNTVGVTLARAREVDLRATAAMHVAELPHGLFPHLGSRFVERWHRAHLRSDYGVIIVAVDGDAVVGFLVGTIDRRAHVAWIMAQHRREFLVAGGLAMLARPWLIASFLRTRGRRYARRILAPRKADAVITGPAEASAIPSGNVAVLEAVVVDYPARGRGIGTAHVDAFLANVAAAGIDQVELVTKADARGAGGFYERGGWRRVGSHIDRDGDAVLTFRISPSATRVP